MKTIHLNLILSIFLVSISCKKKSDDNADIVINLETKVKNNPMGFSQRPFHFLDSIPKGFKGIINKDSSLIGYIPTINLKDYNKLYSQNNISKDTYDGTPTKIYCLSGFNNGKQFYVLDLDANHDFSDDEVIEFNKSLTNETKTNEALINSFPSFKMKINKLRNNKIYSDSIYISLYPNTNYFTYKHQSFSKKETFKRQLLVIARFIDYPFGTFSLFNKKYKVAIGKYGGQGIKLIFREKDSSFHKYNDVRREEYELLDTLKIGPSYFRIDEFVYNPMMLKLKKLQIKEQIYGFRKGNIVKNYQVEDLDGNISHIKNLFKKKKIILLDFWGTWCAPCKKLTPDLVVLNKKYDKKINFVSLAYEKDPKQVKDYISTNGMNWYNGIVKGMPKSGKSESKILTDLRIEAYPTFILLDSNLKILYRGHGGTFKEMVSFLDEYYSE